MIGKNINRWFISIKCHSFYDAIFLEKLNLYDYFERYQKEHLTKWKDFVGRVKAGNKPAVLYPNLDLSKVSSKCDGESV